MSRPSRRTPWRERVEEILSDGEWHLAEELIREGSKVIPPGLGFRKAEINRQRPTDPSRGAKGPRKKGDQSDAIASGQRSLMNQTLLTQVAMGYFQRKWDGGTRYFRSVRHANQLKVRLAEECRREVAKAARSQIVYWQRAFNMIGGNQNVRDAMIGADPVEELEKLLARIEGEWTRD